MLQDFKSVSDHFGTLCIKELRKLYKNWKRNYLSGLKLKAHCSCTRKDSTLDFCLRLCKFRDIFLRVAVGETLKTFATDRNLQSQL